MEGRRARGGSAERVGGGSAELAELAISVGDESQRGFRRESGGGGGMSRRKDWQCPMVQER